MFYFLWFWVDLDLIEVNTSLNFDNEYGKIFYNVHIVAVEELLENAGYDG